MISTAREIPPKVSIRQTRIPSGGVMLDAEVAVPAKASGVVILAHGNGLEWHRQRHSYTCDVLHEQGIATVIAELLAPGEEMLDPRKRSHLRFYIPLFARRLAGIAAWVWEQPDLQNLECGYIGEGVAAAAVLMAAANQEHGIRTVVARSGRPDLAREFLERVSVPVLLIVGGRDREVLRLNEEALALLNADSRLDVVPRASHRFEEAGAMEAAAQLTADWFARHLG